MAIEFDVTPATAAPAPTSASRSRPGRRRVRAVDRMLFTERLALLLETGVPLHNALRTLSEQAADRPALAELTEALLASVVEGRTFSTALRAHPEVFSSSYVQLVAAAESGGFLPEVLRQLVLMDEQNDRMRSTLVAAFSYPALLAVFSTAVVTFVLIWVFPKFGDLFHSIRGELPATTLALMGLSELVRRHWMLIFATLAAVAVVAKRWIDQPAGREFVDRLKLRVPLVREIFVRLYVIMVMRILSLSFGHGVSATEALAAAREVVRNTVFRQAMLRVEQAVDSGLGLAAGFRDIPFLPPMVYQMVHTAEQAGSLAVVLGRIADFYERELQRALGTFSRLAEPTMLVVMGSVVGVMVSSLILPIFKLSRVVH